MSKYKLVTDYPVKKYRCGLKAGDKVRRIVVKNHLGMPTGKVHAKGGIWIVLPGINRVVWLLQPDGERHTWDDDESIFDTFERYHGK